jgi:hypothetical protein
VMVGVCRDFNLKNLIGIPVQMESNNSAATECKLKEDTPFTPLFAKHGNKIARARVLHLSHEQRTIFLTNPNGYTTGFFVTADKGRCAFLPCFGDFAPVVLESILDEVLPELSPHLLYDDKFAWLTETEYLVACNR